MTIKEFLVEKMFKRNKVLKLNGMPNDNRDTFINNIYNVLRAKIDEYNIWYEGDSDELLNYYTEANTIEYNYEPYYDRNKRNYFWAISTTEEDIKRTHSGQPRNIVDTLVNICRFPVVRTSSELPDKDIVAKNLDKIIQEGKIRDLYHQVQLPKTLVQGWGCYRIDWNLDISDYPYPVYYDAKCVDFVYKANRVVSVIFKDFYTDEKGKEYMLSETRSVVYNHEKNERCLRIEYELFRKQSEDSYEPIDIKSVPMFANKKPIEITNFDQLLAVPCILFRDTGETGAYGRSLFAGKIDLFDDLDQCLSQSANSVRKSTPVEYFNSEFLERDKFGMPVQPHAYDRKYTVYKGGMNADGEAGGNPVQISQPQIDFSKYSTEAVQIMLQIINGIMSPATLGIDIGKKDNAEAQREKEKVTIFTRNAILDGETEILRSLFSQLLCANEALACIKDGKEPKITVKEYDIKVRFSEFADDSFENKLKILGEAMKGNMISPEMYLEKLYGADVSDAIYKRESDFIMKNAVQPRAEGLQGIGGDGANIPGMMDADPRSGQ